MILKDGHIFIFAKVIFKVILVLHNYLFTPSHSTDFSSL